ncbi:MAG: hypothetical protein IIA87_02640 [Nanoarchaeota archaeon]|nr:hypothetical protein [Nanoarchaeota archaeon]
MSTKTNQKQIIISMKIGIILGVFILIFSSSVLAFGVSAPPGYKQIELYPGQVSELRFVIQDGGATGDTTAKVEIMEGSEIIEITDSENTYIILLGKKVSVNTRITIPDDAAVGTIYNVRLSFSTAAGKGGSGLSFGSSIIQAFVVNIGEEPPPPQPAPPEEAPAEVPGEGITSTTTTFMVYIIIGIIILAVIFLIMWMIRKKSKAREIQTAQVK